MTVSDSAGLEALAPDWDGLVRAMRRPSPFLLHGWIVAWSRHAARGRTLAVHVARRDGRVVAALPLAVRRRGGLRIAEFAGAPDCALADLLLAAGEDPAVGRALADLALGSGVDLLDVFGLPAGSRLEAALGRPALQTIERVEAPVIDLQGGWETLYGRRSAAQRRSDRRRRRQLRELGALETCVARAPGGIDRAIDEALRLHALRWRGRPDRSGLTTRVGARFQRSALHALAEADVLRIVTLRLDGRAIAYECCLLVGDRMYGHSMAFDPDFARFSPGTLVLLDALRLAAEEGARCFELLGGDEPYKLDLSGRPAPLYQGLLPMTAPGRVACAARIASVRARRRLKRSGVARTLYDGALADPRRAPARIGR